MAEPTWIWDAQVVFIGWSWGLAEEGYSPENKAESRKEMLSCQRRGAEAYGGGVCAEECRPPKKNKVLTLCQSKDPDEVEEEKDKGDGERTYGAIVMERLTGSVDGRVDHMLQDKTFEHAYISAIGSHTNYWRDYDTALFILEHLYSEVVEDPSEQSCCGTSSLEGTEYVDEDTPLTFSDRLRVAKFSKKRRNLLGQKHAVQL